MGKALEFDKSLFERLYTGPLFANMTRTMLDVGPPCLPAAGTLLTLSVRLGPVPFLERDGTVPVRRVL